MNKLYNIGAAVGYVIAFFILFPFYQYQIDSDGISYIKVAERLAANNFADALNGYWSPLPSLLLAPFIKLGYNPVLAAKYINGLLGLLCIFSLTALLEKFTADNLFKKLAPFVIALLCLSFCINELCADLLSLFILSIYFNVVFDESFIHKKSNLLLIAIVGAVAYFAKGYNFFFFLAHISITLLLYSRQEAGKYFSLLFIKKWALVILVFFTLTSPYIYSLSAKYKQATVNTAGRLNTSWQIAPGETDSQRVVIPPPYANGISYWDDPFCVQKKIITPFTSPKYFFKQLKLIAHNSIVFFKILTVASVSWMISLPLFLILLWKRKKEKGQLTNQLLAASALLYPAGYLLIVIEWRYNWILAVFLLAMNAILLTEAYQKGQINKLIFNVLTIIVLLSFCINPVKELFQKADENKYEYYVAAALQKENINGKFISIIDNGGQQASLSIICYLTNSSLMGSYKSETTLQDIQQASRQYSIQYFVQFYSTAAEKNKVLQNQFAKSAVKIYADIYPGILIYKLY